MFPKKHILLLFIVLGLTIFIVWPCQAALVGNTSQATLTASPQSGSYSVGNNFSVGIYINTNSQRVVGVSAYLIYDKTHFNAVSVDTTGSVFTIEWEKIIDSTNGKIKISRTIPTPGVNTANGLVATINFTAVSAVSPTSDNLTFEFTPGVNINSQVILDDGLGTNILSGVYNARYTVSGGADTTPPTISSVSASSITSSGATISWTTNENSDSQVQYGLTTSYGSQTTLNTSLVTSHSQGLTGLLANTTYHYRVKSRDAAGNLATSGDYTFTTGGATCTNRSLVSSSVSPSSVTSGGSYTVNCDYGVTTNAINPVVGSGSCTFLNFVGTAARFSCTAGSTAGTFSNSCALSNTSPDYYCARSDTIASLTVTAPTVTPPSGTTVPTTPTNLSATAMSSSQINLSWTASTDDVGVTGYRIYRCEGVGCTPATQISTVTTNSYSDTNLSGSTIYNYRVAAYDAAGNVSTQSSSAGAITLTSTVTPTPTPPTPTPTSTATSTPTPTPTPTPTATPFTKDLYLGIKDSQVQALQEFLARDKTIYPEGIITGFFGNLTQRAVQRFQCQYNIICSGSPFVNGYGMVGPRTRAKLNGLYTGAPQTEEELIAQLQAQIKVLQEKILQVAEQINQLLKERGLIQ